MTKTEARRIHTYFEASGRLVLVLTASLFAMVLLMGVHLDDALALTGFAMAFGAVMAAVVTDLMSKRIPDNLSLIALASAVVWWGSILLGSKIPAAAGTGIVLDVMGHIYGVPSHGSVLPVFAGIGYPWRALLDLAGMAIVFVPLFYSSIWGLGFGGGDVKLMTAVSLFFGWPLGFDFVVLTFLIGGSFSACFLVGRIFARVAIKGGISGRRIEAMAKLKEFPFAPAIGAAAIVCFALKLRGLA